MFLLSSFFSPSLDLSHEAEKRRVSPLSVGEKKKKKKVSDENRRRLFSVVLFATIKITKE